MNAVELNGVSFRYAGSDRLALEDISFAAEPGEFIIVCGLSSSGKSTLLRTINPLVAPHGERFGDIYLFDSKTDGLSPRGIAARLAYIPQFSGDALVCDTVRHELIFGAQSLGLDPESIERRLAEISHYFGLGQLLDRRVSDLSSGQKASVSLAAALCQRPNILLLDEPLASLDPVSASRFLDMLQNVNRDVGITVVMAEHLLDEAAAHADRLVVLDSGKVFAAGAPDECIRLLRAHPMLGAIPVPAGLALCAGETSSLPMTVSDGRRWLAAFGDTHGFREIPEQLATKPGDTLLTANNIWFRYNKEDIDIVRGLDITLRCGEIFAILGGNGAGKSTVLSLLCGALKPYRGKISAPGSVCALPQDARTLFGSDPISSLVNAESAEFCGICQNTLEKTSGSLSAGELSLCAIAAGLSSGADVLLFDEPTRGLDACGKARIAKVLRSVSDNGAAIAIVSHDAAFCADLNVRAALLSDGKLVAEGGMKEFFCGNAIFTTAAARLSRGIIQCAATASDVFYACGLEYPDIAPPKAIKKSKPPTSGGIRTGPDRRSQRLAATGALIALAAAGRAAFFMLPQVKPMAAIVVIAGVALGLPAGVTVGVMAILVSNLFSGHGPWTLWQCAALAVIGALSGLFRGVLSRSRVALAAFGALSTFVIYGGIMNVASAFMFSSSPTLGLIVFFIIQGAFFDMVHAVSTVVFLLILGDFMLSRFKDTLQG